jgi:hypothetical protein
MQPAAPLRLPQFDAAAIEIDVSRRLAHGEYSHATRDHRRVRKCFLCSDRRISFQVPAPFIVFRNAGLRSPAGRYKNEPFAERRPAQTRHDDNLRARPTACKA